MYIIGERINGMFTDVRDAIVAKDGSVIQDLAKRQVTAGADALDVNVGPASSDAEGTLLWLVENIRAVTQAPVAIDNAKWSVMKKVVPEVPGKVIINSSKADEDTLQQFVGLALETNASLVALTIDRRGVPADVDRRIELGAQILTVADAAGLPANRLFIDTIILPVNVAPQQPLNVLQAMQQIGMLADPKPHLVLGLSNVSQNCNERSLINRTYLAMAIACGLDSAILDPLDEPLVDAAITAELLMNKAIYCDSFLIAERKRKPIV
ncbi:MAG: dihydropteroate synthase [Planctomycetota bacterium]|jgi:5-methyltetrahydrofolate corrinoid/iron sulfur protein methyltransferase